MPSIRVAVACFVLASLGMPCVVRAQGSTGLMSNPNLSPGTITRPDLNNPSVSLDDAGSRAVMESMRSLRDDYRQKQSEIDRERREGSQGNITALEIKKERELDEYRRGEFCSGCGRTRSDILAHDPYPAVFPHPGQHVIPATQEQLDAKTKEWDDKIAQAKLDQQAALLRLDRLTLEQNQIVKNTEAAVLQWKAAMRREDDARAAAYNQRLADFKQQVADTHQAIQLDKRQLASEEARGKNASPEMITSHQNDLNRDLGHLGSIGVRAGEEFIKKKAQADAFAQSLSQGMTEAGSILREVGGQALIPGTTMLGYYNIKSPSSLPVSGSISSSGITVSANLGALRSSLAYSCDWLRDECKLNVSMASTLPLLSNFSAGMTNTTSYDANGVSTTTTPTVKAGSVDVLNLMKSGGSSGTSSGGTHP